MAESNEPLTGTVFVYALAGLLALVLLGGGSHVLAQGFALLLTGALLLKYPPRGSLGRVGLIWGRCFF